MVTETKIDRYSFYQSTHYNNMSFFKVRQFISIVMSRVMEFNAAFNNMLFISGKSVLLVEKTGVPRENHRPAASY